MTNWRLLPSLLLLPILLCSAEDSAYGDEEVPSRNGFVNLFDGRTLHGWHAVPADCSSDWSVRDGNIVGRGSADRLAYLVWNDEDLADFELEFEYRLPGEGNTGIELRALPDPSGKRPFQGYHADLGHIGIGDHILGAWDFHFASRPEPSCRRGTRLVIDAQNRAHSTAISNALRLSDVRHQDWNRVRIVARGNHFRFMINDRISSEFTDQSSEGQLHRGAIGLQIHDRGMTVEFRSLRIKRLPSK